MFEVSVEKAETIRLPDLLDSVRRGEEVIFTQNDLPVARLVGVRQEKPRPQFGSAKGLFVVAEDFDEPLEDFDEYRK
jgi:antitoxin (DNA-binding transcriptional repressor) of toxin-antitoxin stability system